MGPLEAVKPWQTNQLMGVVRFRDRVFNIVKGPIDNAPISNNALLKEMHKTIKKVTNDVEKLAFNTAISNLMIYSNLLASIKTTPPPKEAVETLILLLSPFAPHVAEECWNLLGHSNSLAYVSWPKYSEELCVESIATIVIQINGKVRGKLELAKDIKEEEVLAEALLQANINKYTQGASIKKTIYVSGKILNILL